MKIEKDKNNYKKIKRAKKPVISMIYKKINIKIICNKKRGLKPQIVVAGQGSEPPTVSKTTIYAFFW